MLKDLQSLLIRALNDADPVGTVDKGIADLSESDRKLLQEIDKDGLILSGLVVRKLRFERLMRGDSGLEAWFNRDGEGFTAAFRKYNAEVPPTEYFPRDEAVAFSAWCKKHNLNKPGAAGDVKE